MHFLQFMTRCPPSAYAPSLTYNITETWIPGTSASYVAQCQPGYCGMPTTLACDPTTGTLSGTYPVCSPYALQAGLQPLPIRAQSAGVNIINVSCAPGFTPDPTVSASSWALGSCTLGTGSSVVSMPSASALSCIPTGAAFSQLMQPNDPQWWLTSDATWTSSVLGASVIQLNSLGVYSGGMAFYTPFQINVNPGFSLQFDVSFRAPLISIADGITFAIHNDPRGAAAPTCPLRPNACSGFTCSISCANTFSNGMYLFAPKTYTGQSSNYLTTGAFLSGSAIATVSAGNYITSMPSISNGDVISWSVNYTLASGTLSWSASRTAGAPGTQSWTQTIGDLRPVLKSSNGWLGFTAATGGLYVGHQIGNVRVSPQCSVRECALVLY